MELIKKYNQKRLNSLFCKLAKIPSPSGYEQEISDFLISELKKIEVPAKKDSYGNIVARIKGHGRALIFCAHMDTTNNDQQISVKPVVSKNTIINKTSVTLGADNKDAVAAILETLTIIKERKLKHRTLEIIFTKEEEAISKGAKNLDLSLISGKECIVADSAGPFGKIIMSAPYCFEFEVKITGKKCHVKEPEKGVNASLIAARVIARLPLGRIDKLTTCNVAYSFSGLKGVYEQKNLSELKDENSNSVPDFAVVLGEVRGADLKIVQKTLKEIEKIFSSETKNLKGKMEMIVTKLADGYLFKKDHLLIKQIGQIFREQGVKPKFINSVSGSDANILNGRGIISVCISSAYYEQHKNSEYLGLSDLYLLTDFFLKMAIV